MNKTPGNNDTRQKTKAEISEQTNNTLRSTQKTQEVLQSAKYWRQSTNKQSH